MASRPRSSARKRSGPARKRLLSHRNLLLLETVLLVGLAKEVLELLVLTHPSLHPLVRVLLGMIVVIGAFGGLLMFFEEHLQRSLEQTQAAVQRLPIPTPVLGIHLAVLVGIFMAYAWFWNGETGALHALRALVESGVARVVAAL